ncbi:MAG: PASTA domain-containing protein [Bacteroidaceae bacterium]|nr:PASTA domain-containing protein [Bacteroidaceae bacterium]
MNEFFKKLTSPIVYWNLIIMVVVSIVLLIGLWFWMKDFSHHGESVEVPQIKGMLLADAQYELEKAGLAVVISDSSYNRNQPAGTVLEMTPAPGSKVKTGRNIYLTINTRNVPTLPIPDIADNCSLREAEARLKSLGFKLGPIEYAPGDKDWVLSVKCKGRTVVAGDRVEIDCPITLVVGNNNSGIGDGFDDEEWEEFSEVETPPSASEEEDWDGVN